MGWTIKGEAGKALDDTVRDLAVLNFETTVLALQSLASDTLKWSAAVADATGSGTITPDISQIVELWHDDGMTNTRRFRGHVTIPRISTKELQVTAEGPWWWMTRIQLTQSQVDGEGSSGTRANYVFPTQDLKTSIEALIDRAIANGVPMQRGTVSAMFSYPRLTLSERSCGQALADLMSIVPDAVAWFDYSVAGLPALNVTRRGDMSAATLTVGTDAVEVLDLYPRLEQKVEYVEIQSVTRNATTGETQWASETSGTPAAGRNQIVVVSGPEPAAFLPKDRYDSVALKTFTMPTGGISIGSLTTSSSHSATSVTGDAKTFVIENDEAVATMIREFGSSFSSYLYLSNGGRFLVSLYTTGNLSGAPAFYLDKPNLISKDSTSGMYVVSTQTRLPDWMTWENGYTVTDATLTGFLRYTRDSMNTIESWWDEGVRRAAGNLVGYKANVSSTASYYQRNLFFEFAIPVQLIGTSFASLTTVHRQWDYDYVSPPAGLAAALVAAQNWTPWEGRIQTVADVLDGSPDLQKKFHVAGALPDCASMGALAKSLSYDLKRGRKTITLGPPARTDFSTLASRFRGHPKDNIVYL